MAQGKKKRKIAAKKKNSNIKKQEVKPITEQVTKDIEPEMKSAIKSKKIEDKTPMEEKTKEQKAVTKKSTSPRKKEEIKDIKKTSSGISEKTKQTTTKRKTTASTNNKKKTTSNTKKETSKEKPKTETIEEKKHVTKVVKKESATKKKKETAEKEETSKKKTTETKKKETKTSATSKTKKDNTKEKSNTIKKKTSSKKTVPKKGTGKNKEVTESLKDVLKNIPKKEIGVFLKRNAKIIGAKIFIFLVFLAKYIKIGAIWLYNHAKIVGKKGKELFLRFLQFLKVVFKNLKKNLQKFLQFIKKRWFLYKEKQNLKKEAKKERRRKQKEEQALLEEKLKKEQEEQILKSSKEEKQQYEVLPKERKVKKKKSPIFYVTFLSVLGIVFVVLVGLPYGTKVYKSGASGKILEVPKLSILKEECCNFSATFTSIRSANALKDELDKLIANYEKLECDNVVYYYNPEGDYTITDYIVTKGKIFNEFTITYGNGNSCDIDTTFKKLELLSPSFSIADAKKDGNYVIEQGKVYNAISYDNFMKDVENKTPSTLRIVTTNNEGDVIITDLEYLSDGKFKVTHDKTRDRNSKENYILAYKYEHIGIYKNKFYAYNGSGMSDELVKSSNSYYLFDIEK